MQNQIFTVFSNQYWSYWELYITYFKFNQSNIVNLVYYRKTRLEN